MNSPKSDMLSILRFLFGIKFIVFYSLLFIIDAFQLCLKKWYLDLVLRLIKLDSSLVLSVFPVFMLSFHDCLICEIIFFVVYNMTFILRISFFEILCLPFQRLLIFCGCKCFCDGNNALSSGFFVEFPLGWGWSGIMTPIAKTFGLTSIWHRANPNVFEPAGCPCCWICIFSFCFIDTTIGHHWFS